MCREKTSIRPNVSFHLCLQESHVLTVAHSNESKIVFILLPCKVRSGNALIPAGCACPKSSSVLKRACKIADIRNIIITDALLKNVAAAGMNPLQ